MKSDVFSLCFALLVKSSRMEEIMERAIDVAQYIYEEYKKISGKSIDEMKLHKLLYFCQRESLALTNEPMFSDEFEGWKYGPVCRPIRTCYTEDGMFSSDIRKLSFQNAYIVKNIILQYGAYESWKLSELSHQEISWKESRKGIPDGCNGCVKLKLEDIREDAKKVRPYDSIWDMYYDEFEDAEVL